MGSAEVLRTMRVLAVLLVLALIPLPIFLGLMIEQFKPTGSPKNPIVYDQDGKVPFDDKVYNEMWSTM